MGFWVVIDSIGELGDIPFIDNQDIFGPEEHDSCNLSCYHVYIVTDNDSFFPIPCNLDHGLCFSGSTFLQSGV